MTEKDFSPKDAAQMVREYLARMEARDLDGAKALLHPDFEMIFPGDRRFADFSQLLEWAALRYQQVGKTIERVDAAPADDGIAVTCFGTLHGIWPDGTPFDGIRYADWFLITDGRIRRQLVWNDLAEVKWGG